MAAESAVLVLRLLALELVARLAALQLTALEEAQEWLGPEQLETAEIA
jgi:hypothetical protein